mmetsp:Transcript_4087/g.25727  ORF Transcript_4087/g.25727 Transcript_4087/m.25727 type:complete len:104 (-) Transcript_4087:2719-3030(-)
MVNEVDGTLHEHPEVQARTLDDSSSYKWVSQCFKDHTFESLLTSRLRWTTSILCQRQAFPVPPYDERSTVCNHFILYLCLVKQVSNICIGRFVQGWPSRKKGS